MKCPSSAWEHGRSLITQRKKPFIRRLSPACALSDTARYYGNEVSVGRGLKRAISEGIVTREEVFITGKIYGGNYERAGRIINDELKDLQVDYLDLLLIHQPGSDDAGVYKAMEESVNDHRIRSLGISNYYTKEAVDKVLSFATIKPAVIQNENHLYYPDHRASEIRQTVRHSHRILVSFRGERPYCRELRQ